MTKIFFSSSAPLIENGRETSWVMIARAINPLDESRNNTWRQVSETSKHKIFWESSGSRSGVMGCNEWRGFVFFLCIKGCWFPEKALYGMGYRSEKSNG